MTGLLHRLAARATGTAWTVRSDARLPFAAAAVESLEDSAPPLLEAAAPARHGSTQAVAPMPPMAPDVPIRTTVRPPPAGGYAAKRDATQAAGAKASVTDPSAVERPRVPAPKALPATIESAEPHAFAPTVSTTSLARSGTQAPRQTRSAPQAPQAAEPAALLPAQPRRASDSAAFNGVAPAPAAFANRVSPQAAAPTETEVHIHIGRIDVTALHEAPRPKARSPERSQTVSLDAYLAARSKS